MNCCFLVPVVLVCSSGITEHQAGGINVVEKVIVRQDRSRAQGTRALNESLRENKGGDKMAKVLIVYDSHTGNTEKMAQAVEEGAKGAETEVRLRKVAEAELADLEWADGIIIGSPNYFGTMSAKMKGLVDKSVQLYGKGKLKHKVGATFASAAGSGTGGETTALSLLTAMVIHEMVIVSAPGRAPGSAGTYGVIADGLGLDGTPGEQVLDNCKRLGKRVADVAKKLA